MKTFAILGLSAALAGLPSARVTAGTLSDVCQVRAETVSGYSGARSGLNWQVGKVRLRLSGTAAFGISYSSDAGISGVSGNAGRDVIEQRQERARQEYTRIYDACISAG